jgi:hypothetical protein
LELRHALAIEVGEFALDEENLPEIENMVSVCAGLVTVDKESGIIRLIHYIAQEYFKRASTFWFPNAENYITMNCVTYLSFDIFETGFCLTDKEYEARLRLNPFYDYTARNWKYHTQAALKEVEQLILEFFKSEAKVSASNQAMMAFKFDSADVGYSQRMPKQMTGIHLGAGFGLREAIIAIFKNGIDPDIKDSHGRTPLSWATENGHEAVVELLLATDGVNPDPKDCYGETPLS